MTLKEWYLVALLAFDGHTYIWHPISPNRHPALVSLGTVQFWVHVYNLPSGFWNKGTNDILGAQLGTLMAMEMPTNSRVARTFMRLRIYMNAMEPKQRRNYSKSPSVSFTTLTSAMKD